MRLVRDIMQDRSSAGAIAMLALLLFLLQGLANGFTNGTMASAALAADEIICSIHTQGGASEKQDPAGKLANNCCGTMCRLASASGAAIPSPVIEFIPAPLQTILLHFQPVTEVLSPPSPNLGSRPRGPPFARDV